VFCGARDGERPLYREAAAGFGRRLAQRGLGLVYGGGRIGLMGALADAALAAGGEVIGVIPNALAEREVAHASVTHMHFVESMHERKALMSEHADAFVALPGGYGTLDEFFEALTELQLGYHTKPCGVLDVDGYFDRLIGMLDHAVSEGFVSREDRVRIAVEKDPDALLDRLLGPALLLPEA
jgi:uncharacterized protein (TIGR00730 family)